MLNRGVEKLLFFYPNLTFLKIYDIIIIENERRNMQM